MFSNLSDHELLNIILVINFVYIGYRILRSSLKIIGFLVLFIVFGLILADRYNFDPLHLKQEEHLVKSKDKNHTNKEKSDTSRD